MIQYIPAVPVYVSYSRCCRPDRRITEAIVVASHLCLCCCAFLPQLHATHTKDARTGPQLRCIHHALAAHLCRCYGVLAIQLRQRSAQKFTQHTKSARALVDLHARALFVYCVNFWDERCRNCMASTPQQRHKCAASAGRTRRSYGPVRASLVFVACNCEMNARQHRRKCDATTIVSVLRLAGLQHRL